MATEVHVDIIGDVHGCCDALEKLLESLGYELVDGVYCHSNRKAIFVGDLLDRGPQIRECVTLVKAMHDGGHAYMVLGNHEYNALVFRQEIAAWLSGDSLDELKVPKRLQLLMRETLTQYSDYPDLWDECCQWLQTLPLFIETEHYRVVHACWDHKLIERYRETYADSGINAGFVEQSKVRGSVESAIADRLTRGTSMPLPEGVKLESKDGFIRRFFRTKFWEPAPKTYGDIVFQPDPLPYDFAEHPIHQDHQDHLLSYSAKEPPVFFGHYWLSGKPKPLQKNVACLDYSAVNYGRLTAYQFDGEPELSDDKFRWVYVSTDSDVDGSVKP
ncbi:MAG: metallophosphoesterase [Cellvibrionaceae bacterium]